LRFTPGRAFRAAKSSDETVSRLEKGRLAPDERKERRRSKTLSSAGRIAFGDVGMRDLIETLVKELVTAPEEVVVHEAQKPGSVTYEIYVMGDDAGKVIGKGGRIISSLRTIAKAAAVRDGIRVFVEVMS
jgi:predicted RNA-binding protein YlqC (UPF0109 family)